MSNIPFIFTFSLISMPLAAFSAVVFYTIIRQSHSALVLFKLYFAKSVVDFLMLIFNVIINGLKLWCYFCNMTPVFFQVDFFISYYIIFILLFLSIYLEFAATFNIYKKLSQHFKLFDKIPAYYEVNYASFRWTTFGKIIRMANSLTRDGVFVALILFFDVLIAFKMREIISKKKKMQINLSIQKSTKRKDRNENRISLMVIFSSLIVSISHFLVLLDYVFYLNKTEPTDLIFQIFQDLFMYLVSPGCTFFIYFFFNKSFSNIVKGILLSKIVKFRK
jgi:hypothetical protein